LVEIDSTIRNKKREIRNEKVYSLQATAFDTICPIRNGKTNA